MPREEFHELPQYDLQEDDIKMLPYDYCVKNYVVVLDSYDPANDDNPVIGMLHPEDEQLVEEIEEKLGYEIETVQLNGFEIRKALGIGYETEELSHEDIPSLVVSHQREISFGLDQSPTEMLMDLLSEAIKMGASDVHIECYPEDVDLRFRIDGVLRQITTPLSVENVHRVISKLKVMCELDITETRRDQDGRFSVSYIPKTGKEREVDVRLSVVPGPNGEDAVMRILDREQYILDLNKVGFQDTQLNQYRNLIHNPGGMILVVGTTGSGKTTTLYASVSELFDDEKKILTAEDPIEYEFQKVNQKQVNDSMGFADYTRAFLRQDPDIILIGEIRDETTAEISVRAANTGHLVLSTLHTGNAIMSISRLRSLKVDDDYLADVLLGVVSQRLVRKICENCKTQTDPEPKLIEDFYQKPPTQDFWTGEGCEECGETGYNGRTGIFEVLTIDEQLQDRIATGVPTEVIRKKVKDRGFKPLHKHALEKVRSGITSLEEVARVVMPPVRLKTLSE
ncbi:MAG: GspE/PulE family protein [bacterium]